MNKMKLVFPNESKFLENLHFVDFDSIIVCNDGFQSASFDILISQENFVLKDLDLESNLVK